jgi:predicted phosphoribosyltransferase
MRFQDRTEAGRLLAARLAASSIPSPFVVAGIPRGGVLVAQPVAAILGAPLSIVHARKLTFDPASGMSLGAVDENGEVLINSAVAPSLNLNPGVLEGAEARARAGIRRQKELYRARPIAGFFPAHAVVLVDDGLATGLTMGAAVAYVRRLGARAVTVAIPCASSGAARRIKGLADGFVSLVVDPQFVEVSSYYNVFPSISDQEVAAVLAQMEGATVGEAGGSHA